MAYSYLAGGTSPAGAYSNPSYTVRCFYPDYITTTITNQDIQYHSAAYFGTLTLGATVTYRSPIAEGWVGTGSTQTNLDVLTQTTLDTLSQAQLGANTFVTTNADGFQNAGLQVSIGTATNITLDSTYTDNLTTGVFASGTWFLQFPIFNFPGTAATVKLDLANSYVVLSSSGTFAPSATGSVAFSSGSLVNSMSLAGAGNGSVIWKVNRTAFSSLGVDLANLKKVRFILKGTGSAGSTFLFTTGPMKQVGPSYLHNTADVDTKLGLLKQERWPGTAQPAMPAPYQTGLTVKNFRHITRFSSGTLPGTATPNKLNVYTRIDDVTPRYVNTEVVSNSSFTQINVYTKNGAPAETLVKTVQGPTLGTSNYYLVVTHNESIVNAKLYSANEFYLNSTILDTENITLGTAHTIAGYTGYRLQPQTGDFAIDNIYTQEVVLGQYESKSFKSNLPVTGATIFVTGQNDVNLLTSDESTFTKVEQTDNLARGVIEAGPLGTDVVVAVDTTVFKDKSQSLKITKNLANAYIGAVQYPNTITLNEFKNLSLVGNFRFEEPLKTGKFKLVLWDKYRTKILFINEITNLEANVWNTIDIPIISDTLLSNEFILEIGHYGNGTGTGSFWLENIQLNYEAVRWEASNDGGTNYIPFLSAMNDKYKSVNFPTTHYFQTILNDSPTFFWNFNRPIDFKSLRVQNEASPGVNTGTVAGESYWVYSPGTYATTTGTSFIIPSSQIRNSYKNTSLMLAGGSSLAGGTVYTGNMTNPGTANFTFELWFKNRDLTSGFTASNNPFVTYGTIGSPNGWRIELEYSGFSTINPTVQVYIGTVLYYSGLQTTSGWNHFVLTYNSSGAAKAYLNGSVSSSAQQQGTVVTTFTAASTLSVQSMPPNGSSLGTLMVGNTINPNIDYTLVDNISYYPRVLNATQITSHYNAGVRAFNELRVRASGFVRDAWIAGYQLIPHYAELARVFDANAISRQLVSGDFFSLKSENYPDGTMRFDVSNFFDGFTFGN